MLFLKKHIFILALSFAFYSFSSLTTFAAELDAATRAQNSSDSIERNKITPLDEENLKANIKSRMKGLINDPGFQQFTQENVTITDKIPVKVKNMDFYVVRVGMKNLPQLEKDDAKNLTIDLIVDPSGTYQIFDIFKVDGSGSVFSDAQREISKIKMPTEIGTTLFEGDGKAEVIFVSDPFCSYCREEYKFLKINQKKAKRIKMFHMPIPQLHPTALIASAFMEYASENFEPSRFREVVDFAYSDLQPQSEEFASLMESNAGQPITGMEKDVVRQFLKKFPEALGNLDEETFFYLLKGKYAAKVTDGIESLKPTVNVQGTPVTIVDGYVIRGFNVPELEKLIAK